VLLWVSLCTPSAASRTTQLAAPDKGNVGSGHWPRPWAGHQPGKVACEWTGHWMQSQDRKENNETFESLPGLKAWRKKCKQTELVTNTDGPHHFSLDMYFITTTMSMKIQTCSVFLGLFVVRGSDLLPIFYSQYKYQFQYISWFEYKTLNANQFVSSQISSSLPPHKR